MGVPYYPSSQQAFNNYEESNPYYNSNNNGYANSYYSQSYHASHSPPSSSPPMPPSEIYSKNNLSSSGIFSEYMSNGLTTAFLEKYQRQLTVAASSISVIILIVIGTCIWCLVGLVKRGYYDKKTDIGDICRKDDISGSSGGGSSSTPKKLGSNELNSSNSGGSSEDGSGVVASKKNALKGEANGATSSGGRWCGGAISGGRKERSLISKIFSKQNGNSARILAQHRNIITPDKTIPFVVPTVQLPAQPESSRNSESSWIFPDDRHHHSPVSLLDPQPSTSKSVAAKQQALLLAQQFFPQLEHPEADSCPLIAFSLFYEVSSQTLNVRLLEGRNFPDGLIHSVSVKVYPGRGSKQHTKEFKNRSPVYNQEFCVHVRKGSLHTKILKLRAVIPESPKKVIGYVNVALKDLPGFDKVLVEKRDGEQDENGENQILEDLKTTQLWRRVELPSEGGDGVKLQISLKWSPDPGPGLLTLKIIEAAGLHENRDCDYTSSYVKVTLQEQGRSIKTRKTQLVRWGSIPVFDDVFVLTIPRELLAQISFLLVVIARGRLGSKAVLGKICVGPVPYAVASSSAAIHSRTSSTATTSSSSTSASSSGIEFWEDMCHQPDSEIVRWLHLLP